MKLIENSKLFKLPILRNYAAITLGSHIYCAGKISDELLLHEIVHIQQQARLGRARFYASYVWEWTKNMVKYRGNWERSYWEISYEREARGEMNTNQQKPLKRSQP